MAAALAATATAAGIWISRSRLPVHAGGGAAGLGSRTSECARLRSSRRLRLNRHPRSQDLPLPGARAIGPGSSIPVRRRHPQVDGRTRPPHPAAVPACVARDARAIRLVVTILAALILAGLAGCAPASPALSDPREILDRAATNLGQARAVHLDVTIDGTLVLGAIVPGLPGGGGAGGSGGSGALSMTGTHADGDLDLAGGRADLHVQVPALLGLTAELREVGATTYVTSSLTGKGWRRLDASSLPGLGSWQPMAWVDGLRAWIQDPGVVPTRIDDGSCPAGSCYGVRLVIEGAALGAAAPLATLGVDVRLDRLTLDAHVDRGSLRLSQLTVDADLGPAGALQSTIDLTAWDHEVTIAAPPSNEVTSGPLLP